METEFQWYVGIDWATEAHQVCLIDTRGKILQQRSVPHSGDGIAQFVDWLTAFSAGQRSAVGVAIEIPHGTMVETLVERGFGVFSINPKQLDRFRDRFSVAGAKDDSRDGQVLADSLRTDQHCFHRVRLDDALIIQLREWSRLHGALREQANGLTNRLREQLHRYYPQMLRLSPAAAEPWLWALWELAPLPAAAGKLKPERVAKLLRSHRIRRLNSTEVIDTLKATPVFVAPGTAEAASSHIRLLLPHLRLVSQQRATVAKQIQSLLKQISARPPQRSSSGQRSEHSDVEVLRSLPGIGPFVSATMLAEASQALAERDYHALLWGPCAGDAAEWQAAPGPDAVRLQPASARRLLSLGPRQRPEGCSQPGA